MVLLKGPTGRRLLISEIPLWHLPTGLVAAVEPCIDYQCTNLERKTVINEPIQRDTFRTSNETIQKETLITTNDPIQRDLELSTNRLRGAFTTTDEPMQTNILIATHTLAMCASPLRLRLSRGAERGPEHSGLTQCTY